MRTYELLYIIPATLTDEEVAQTETDILSLIQKYGGTTKESRRLGKFKFAYLIKKIRHGYYVLVYFDSEPEIVAKINEALRIHDRVVRHLILLAEEAGGDKFSLVQFQEVVVEGSPKDDRKRKKTIRKTEDVSEDVQAAQELDKSDKEDAETDKKVTETEESAEEVKSEESAKEVSKEDVMPELSADELDKKIDAALTEEAK
ncbi:MAG: 30S ribosomal protein S6 [Patescibacteria group bacterium]|nr:30S ribosomal protein S6 [Patescibacteria group bacterium]